MEVRPEIMMGEREQVPRVIELAALIGSLVLKSTPPVVELTSKTVRLVSQYDLPRYTTVLELFPAVA